MTLRTSLRNIAIIAHVDHGKTTLVDKMLRQTGSFTAHEELTDRSWTPATSSAKRASPSSPRTRPSSGTTSHQHHRHAWSRRLWRRGRTGTRHGRRGHLVSRRRRGSPPADSVRAAKDAREASAGRPRHQQGRPSDARIKEVVEEVENLFLDLDADEHRSPSRSSTRAPSGLGIARRQRHVG